MSDLLAELRRKWEQALACGAGGRQWRAVALATAAPVKLLAGIRDRDGRISVLVEAPVEHAPKHRLRFQADGLSLIDEGWPAEGPVGLRVTGVQAGLREI